MTARPRTIQIYPSGDPRGIRIASLTTSIVQVIDVPRALLPQFQQMREAGQVAVYFLIGGDDSSEDEKRNVYMGQTGGVGKRLGEHHVDPKKDYWNRALVMVSSTDSLSYSREYAILAADLLAFVQETQPTEWAKFKKWHNGQSEQVFVKRVAKQLDTHGTLHVLRHGFKDVDAKFYLCQFKPAHKKNPKLLELFKNNRLTAVRQLHYSLHNENSIDLVLFVNGLPVATGELKTDLTQSVKDAIKQYKQDRQPKDPKTKEFEPLLQFKTRALVHFAISSDLVFMTTKLAGDDTQFLPFNMGRPDGVDMLSAGAGNPPAPYGKGYPRITFGTTSGVRTCGWKSWASSCTWRPRTSKAPAARKSRRSSAARKLREALTKGKPKQKVVEVMGGEEVQIDADVEVDPDDLAFEDMIALAIEARKRPENVSYFAFTATPKNKTLELFGRKGPEGTPVPFHVYSMRQAIEEGFILDVLKHYTSYGTFYKLGAVSNDKLVPQKKAKMALAQYAKLHPHNIAQKVVVIVEHFREHVAVKIGGKAKAMVVTDSRKAAVRYKLAIDKYIKDQKYSNLRTLVAFSGGVLDSESGPDESGDRSDIGHSQQLQQ